MSVRICYCVRISSLELFKKGKKADVMILDLYFILDLSDIKLPFQIAINLSKHSVSLVILLSTGN